MTERLEYAFSSHVRVSGNKELLTGACTDNDLYTKHECTYVRSYHLLSMQYQLSEAKHTVTWSLKIKAESRSGQLQMQHGSSATGVLPKEKVDYTVTRVRHLTS